MYQETSSITPEDIIKLIASTREAGFVILDRSRILVEAHDIPVKTLFKEGHIIQEITATAKEGSYDTIVVGAKGISHISDIPLGSTSEKVVRSAPCSVMVIK